MLDLIVILLKNIGIISAIAIIVTRFSLFRSFLKSEKTQWQHTLFLIVFFGLVGIYGTYAGVRVIDAVANSRVIGPFIGGLVGGPVIGFFAGLIAGAHRYLINPDGFTSLACVLITPLQGLVIGFLRHRIKRWQEALVMGALAEAIHMGAVLLFSRPFSQAVDLVEIIGPPMVIANSIGIALFVLVLDSVNRDLQLTASYHAQRVLEIAKETLVHLRNGLNPEATKKAAEIILKRSHLDAVSFTDTEAVLAHVGLGSEYHPVGEPIRTTITKSVLRSGEYRVGDHVHALPCDCPIHSAVVAPIKIQGKLAGAFKLYKKEKGGITDLDVQLALGLANLFNQQLELELIEKQDKLLSEAEYHALQSQINPHFLFNALNTISSVVRTSPDKGRNLLLSLSQFLRGNLNFTDDISLDQEIEHVKAYIDIEQARYGDKLRVDFELNTNSSLRLPPLTLQPLIENAIKHGVRAKREGGRVIVRVQEEDRSFVFSVIDDGKGIEPNKLKNLLDRSAGGDCIGLINIHQRLIARHGKGLSITSEVDSGTTVCFTIPKK